MFKIRLIKDVGSRKTVIRKGTELLARTLPGNLLALNQPYQVIDGEHSGLVIPLDAAVRVPAEKLYTEAEYNKLLDELRDYEEEAAKLREKHTGMENHYRLLLEMKDNEIKLLQEEINQLVSEKKVALPGQVADALGFAQARFDAPSIMTAIDQKKDGYSLSNVYSWVYAAGKSREIERKWVIMHALINGYTIQETPLERIERGVQAIYEEWTTIQSSGDDRKDGADLAERITKLISEELKL